MKRIQLFEFEDFRWFPTWLRTCLTNLIVVLLRLMGVETALAKLIAPVLKKHNINRIVDLGSGSGGAMPDVIRVLSETGTEAHLTLSDLYPNPSLAAHLTEAHENIEYLAKPIDATQLETAPAGLRTMVNCFHHMPPDKARQILSSAAKSRQPLLIFEIAENKVPTIIWALFLPIGLLITFIMALFLTPLVRPMKWQQLVFTYPIPIIPLFYAWDGQASMPRMYADKDIDKLLEGIDQTNYVWEKGQGVNKKGKKLGTYLLGTPI